MRLHSITCSYNSIVLIRIILLLRTRLASCNPITNLNEHIREFASDVDNINSTNVKTLQKEDPKRYADIVSFRPILFKDIPDSKLSSSSYGRGLVSREHPGYALHDYEEYPHVNYAYDYHIPESHHHGYDHHIPDSYHHGYDHHNFNHDFGHHDIKYLGHHRHYNHALAAKAVLWPIAGIALLGAAAAIVSNPILLQLGVASGKRRRRNTGEISGTDLSAEITEWRPHFKRNVAANNFKSIKTNHLQETTKKNELSTTQRIPYKKTPTTEEPITSYSPLNEESDELNFMPMSIETKY